MNNRDQQAFEMRLAGETFKSIAKKLKYADASGAYQAYQRAREVISLENLTEWRLLELERLDALQRILWEKILEGSMISISQLLKVFDLRAKLIGLYQPERVQIGATIRKDEDNDLNEAVAEMERIMNFGMLYAIEHGIDEPWVSRMRRRLVSKSLLREGT